MFSVLIPVYAGEQPAHFDLALASVGWQTVLPAEIIVVKDGPLPDELNNVIAAHSNALPLRTCAFEGHQGLANALNLGLSQATQPWIMRFDSDDVCLPERVEIQTRAVQSGRFQIVGGQIEEFADDPEEPHRSRIVPCGHDEIVRFAQRRNPFNHMTVCFQREAILAAGGYTDIPHMEDYGLWITLLARGLKAANSPDVLVRARVGSGMISRRGGYRYVRSEWQLQRHMVKLGLKGWPRACIDGSLRSAVFASPSALRKAAFSQVRAR